MADRPRTNPTPLSTGGPARRPANPHPLMGFGPRHRRRALPRGFTLLESMMAATVLGVVVLAVISAVTTAQRLSFEGQKRLLATMAADDFMIELTTVPYDQLKLMNDTTQAVGEMSTLDGTAYPASFWAIGRRIDVENESIEEPSLGVTISGIRVTVSAFDTGADLVHLSMFIPEPTS